MKDYNELIEKRIAEGREYRNMELRASGNAGDEMIVEGYATTFNEPYLLWKEDNYTVYEQVDRNAFTGCDMSDVIMQYDHEGRVFARMSNGTLSCTPDEHGLLTRADLGGTEQGRQLYEEIAGGYTTKMSFGFTVAEDNRDIAENTETGEVTITRTIRKLRKLYDVSAVSLPANPATNIAARTYGEGVIAEAKAERQRAEEERIAKKKLIALINL